MEVEEIMALQDRLDVLIQELNANQEKAKQSGLEPMEAMAVQDEIEAGLAEATEILKKLGQTVKAAQPGKPTPMFDRLAGGKFEPTEFVNMIKQAWNELREIGLDESQALEKVKPPVGEYMKGRAKEIAEAVVEEAIEEGAAYKDVIRYKEIIENAAGFEYLAAMLKEISEGCAPEKKEGDEKAEEGADEEAVVEEASGDEEEKEENEEEESEETEEKEVEESGEDAEEEGDEEEAKEVPEDQLSIFDLPQTAENGASDDQMSFN